MRRILLLSALLSLALTLPHPAAAQDNAKPSDQPAHFYHLEFVVQELDTAGKPTVSHTYTTTVNTSNHFYGSLRTGSKIPVATGSLQDSSKGAAINTQYQYVDVGVNFGISNVVETDRQLSLALTAEVSSLASAQEAAVRQPVIRQNNWKESVLIPVGKPSVILRSDSLDSKGAMQITLTATPVP